MTQPDDWHDRAYDSHQMLLAEARRTPELWRLLVGFGTIIVLVLVANAIIFGLVSGLSSPQANAELLSGSNPFSLLIILSSFAFITASVAIAARLFQRRSLWSIIGHRPLAIAQFWRVLIALCALGFMLLILPPYSFGEPLSRNLAFSTWVLLLPLSVAAVLIQTSAEEILFRGYLQQGLAARFRSPVVWMGVPAILFALGHYAPAAAGGNAILITVWACVFGLITADLTARSGTLGPAIALHFFNNASALLVISLPDNLGGLALFHLPYDMEDTDIVRQWLYVDFVLMIVGWLTARLVLRR